MGLGGVFGIRSQLYFIDDFVFGEVKLIASWLNFLIVHQRDTPIGDGLDSPPKTNQY